MDAPNRLTKNLGTSLYLISNLVKYTYIYIYIYIYVSSEAAPEAEAAPEPEVGTPDLPTSQGATAQLTARLPHHL